MTQHVQRANSNGNATSSAIGYSSSLATIVIGAIAALCGPTTASAQSDGAAELPLEEIIVTASRREERLLDVPAAVSSLNPDHYEDLGLWSIEDLVAFTPGTVATRNGDPTQTSITIRGIADGGTPSVAIYVDDVPWGSAAGYQRADRQALNAGLQNLSRIEVVRGPQGTLYGANAIGGLIKYVTKDPSSTEWSGGASVDWASNERGGSNALVRGYLDIPVVKDRFAISLSAFYNDTDGYVDDAARSIRNWNPFKFKGGLAKLLYMPTEKLTLKFTAMTQKVESENNTNILYDSTTGAAVFGDYQAAGGQDSFTDLDLDILSFTLNYDFGWADLTATSSVMKNDYVERTDVTADLGGLADAAYSTLDQVQGGPGAVAGTQLLFDLGLDTERTTHEIRLTSTNDTGIDWILGLYYTDEPNGNTQVINATTPVPQGLSSTFVDITLPNAFSEFAVFGNVTFDLSDKVAATIGLRRSEADTDFQLDASGPINDFGEIALGQPIIPSTPFTKSSESVTTYLANLLYKPSEQTSLYFRYATGYRPGGPNTPIPGGNPQYSADEVESFEVGARGTLLEGKLSYDTTVYYQDWTDMQIPFNIGGIGITANARGADGVGFEGVFTLNPLDRLSLTAILTYSGLEFSADAPEIGAVKGDSLPRRYDYQTTLVADYSFPFGTTDLEGFVNANWRWFDDTVSDTRTPPNGVAPLDISNYSTIGLTLGVRNDRYSASLYATNLLNDDSYIGFRGLAPNLYFGNPLRPRTIGLVLRADF